MGVYTLYFLFQCHLFYFIFKYIIYLYIKLLKIKLDNYCFICIRMNMMIYSTALTVRRYRINKANRFN